MTIRVGDVIMAIVKLGDKSKTLKGKEGCGRRRGPFAVNKVTPTAVYTRDWKFRFGDFYLVKRKR